MSMHRTSTGLSRYNMGVVDLSLSNGPAHPEFEDAVRVLMDAGFRLTNKARYDEALTNLMDGYDSTNPDVTMVSRGGVDGAAIEYGAVFMNTALAGFDLQIHTALPGNTPQSVLDALSERFDAYFSKVGGVHVGCLTITPDVKLQGDRPYESALRELKALKLETVKLPFSLQGLGWFPFWEGMRESLQGAKNANGDEGVKLAVASKVLEHFGEQSSMVDIPQHLLDRLSDQMSIEHASPSLSYQRRR